ncbi:MAG: class I SAM-dependent RNA methyltransferase [Planctomycetota bacterium]|nr:MAG: class I SAM-dependent RNA methyltransferase [Planctomycetota bacterium]
MLQAAWDNGATSPSRLAVPMVDPKIPLRPGCEPACPACPHRQWTPEQSHRQKQDWLLQRLAPWKEYLAPLRDQPEQRWGYRRRTCLSASWREGGWHFGLQAGDEVLAIPDCPVHAPETNQVLRLLRECLPPPDRFPLRFVVQNEKQWTLVVKSRQFPEDLRTRFNLAFAGNPFDVDGFWLNLHPAAGRRVFSPKHWQLLWGETLSRNQAGLVYGPACFLQVHPSLHRASLHEASEFLQPSPGRPVMDLFCGIGAGLRLWADAGAPTAGVELGSEAVACARRNAPQAEIWMGRVEHRRPQVETWLDRQSATPVVYLNPPRTGMDRPSLEWLAEKVRPSKLVYLSCSAGTLARDLEVLEGAGFAVHTLRPYDFFPQTLHVEVLALLHRPGPR